ncbi:hypothetical protein H4R34_004644 [Dimargaris verticillata]|uniref:Asparagine synthetase domain-containing protein n=1 Tax=Dimargaris verticillata TaxID=2761393 RepID=A0A9W8EC05_9FUNG|nr:hypothetical protein H4R34_004644 [Dimargaris verticillata]
MTMCGIQVLTGPAPPPKQITTDWAQLKEVTAHRGPSVQREIRHNVTAPQVATLSKDAPFLWWYAAVLHLRGAHPVPQPLQDTHNRCFSWNGEVFDRVPVAVDQNDAQVIFDRIVNQLDSAGPNTAPTPSPVVQTLAAVDGPFAFVLWDAPAGQLWFGRDCLGRRSLLWHLPTVEEPYFWLSSISQRLAMGTTPWPEVPAKGLFRLDLAAWWSNQPFGNSLYYYPWMAPGPEIDAPLVPVKLLDDISAQVIPLRAMQLPFQSVRRALPTPDTMVGPLQSPDAAAPDTCPWTLADLVFPPDMTSCAQGFIDCMQRAVQRRTKSIPPLPNTTTTLPLWHQLSGQTLAPFLELKAARPRVAVLFSGGVDCLCIAALLHHVLPANEPIDLINVAFENPRAIAAKSAKHQNSDPSSNLSVLFQSAAMDQPIDCSRTEYQRVFDVPDRKTGRTSARALKAWAPERDWRFVAVNIPYNQVERYRDRVVQLMRPCDTAMDLSIALAIWFAARGDGCLENIDDIQHGTSQVIRLLPYRSCSRVVLLGMGADEQLGGYSQHRSQFQHYGWLGVIEEMQHQLDRIPSRNLGRDDRIVSDHGKEARYPFLSHSVVDYLSGVPVHWKLDARYPRGLGEKLLLRHALYHHLCLPLPVCQQWKRAIQFGARTAKMTTSKITGTDKV